MFTKNRKSLIVRLGMILALFGGVVGTLQVKHVLANTIVVMNTNDNGAGSLRQTVADASPGDTITFDPSLAGETIMLASALSLNKNLTIDGSALLPQVTISGGYGINVLGSSIVVISGLTFAGSNGGAISVGSGGNLTVINSNLTNNEGIVVGVTGLSGSYGFLSLINTAIYENSGGAIVLNGYGNATIINSTIVQTQGNSTVVLVNGGGEANVYNSTIISESGQVFFLNGDATLNAYGSILACTHQNDCWGVNGPTDITFIDSIFGENGTLEGYGLAELADNGGPTKTMALLDGSPLIDAGVSGICAAPPVNNQDQRGVLRPQGGGCDIGAYEYGDFILPTATNTWTPTRTPTHTPTVGPSPTGTNTPTPTPTFAPDFCDVAYVVNQWDTGFTANVTITNNGPATIDGYSLSWVFTAGQQVISGWDATYQQNGTTVEASNPTGGWNGTIPASGGTVSFGFQGAHSGTNPVPANFALNGVSCTGGSSIPTSTTTYTPTFTKTNTVTSTATPTATGTSTATGTPTHTPTITKTNTATSTSTSIATSAPVSVLFSSQSNSDGWILESSETSNMGGTLNTTATVLYVGDNAQDKQYRSFLSFNTAGLPDDAVITSVKLKIRVQGFVGDNMFTPVKTHGNLLMDIRDPYFGTNANLVVSDFQKGASMNAAGVLTSAPTTGWYTVNLKSGAYGFVNRMGKTQFRLRFQTDDNNDMAADHLKIFSGDAPMANRPQLIVEYYVP